MSMNLKSMTIPEIGAILKDMGQPAFRAKQVYTWLHKGVRSFEEMTNLPRDLRERLAENYPIYAPKVVRKQESQKDGTIKYLWKLALEGGAMELVRAVDEQLPDIGIQLNTEKCIYFNKDNSAMERFRRVTGVPDIRCHYDEVEEEVLKVVFGHDDPERIDDLRRLLTSHPMAEQFDFIRSEKRLFEILPKGASKGGLLMKMSELLGIDEKKTIAIGDYDNDISMISAAGVGFAVANATEGARAVADFITVSNNEHAIADAIRMLDDGTVKL